MGGGGGKRRKEGGRTRQREMHEKMTKGDYPRLERPYVTHTHTQKGKEIVRRNNNHEGRKWKEGTNEMPAVSQTIPAYVKRE